MYIHTYHTIHTYIYLIHAYIHSTCIHKVYSYIQLIHTVHTYSIYIIHSKSYIHTYIHIFDTYTDPNLTDYLPGVASISGSNPADLPDDCHPRSRELVRAPPQLGETVLVYTLHR